MKSKTYIYLLIIFFIIGPMLSGCSAQGVYGQSFAEANITSVGDILANPQQFDRKTVQVEGKIIEECPAGGWFMLKDAAGVIFVNLHPSYFAIPQAVGSNVIAEGKVKRDGQRVEIVGQGVKIK